MNKIFICLAILCCVGVVSAEEPLVIKSYNQTVELEMENSFHEVLIDFDAGEGSSDISLAIPPRIIDKLEVKLDGESMSCFQEEEVGFTFLSCTFPESLTGSHNLKLSFETLYPIFKIENRILYRSEYIPLNPTEKLSYILKLPKGYVIPEEKETYFFISPESTDLYSDGQRVILLWEAEEVIDNFEVSVLIEPVDGNLLPFPYGSIVFVVVLVLTVFYFKKRGRADVSYSALIKQEQTIVELLKGADENVMWQKEIQHKSGLSKVKVSRILRTPEERGVIKKEQVGNTNRIHLIFEKETE